MPGFVYISGLFDMPRYMRELGPSHLISIIQPEFQPDRPPEVTAERHLRVAVHDVSEPDGFSVLVQADHVRRLIDFSQSWQPEEAPLLVHCYAGVSRSTAAALIAHVLRSGDPQESVQALRDAAPYAMPNRRIVALADDELGFAGALVEATERMGPPGFRRWDESLAVLPLPE
jgi:predicted protein tyrosine phosphatase